METKLNDDILQAKDFIHYVREALADYRDSYRKAETELSKKGQYFKRGAYDRTLYIGAEWFAEQYALCLNKQCKEPSAIRRLVCIIGDRALIRFYNKLQEQNNETTSDNPDAKNK